MDLVGGEPEQQKTDRSSDRQRDWRIKDFAYIPSSQRHGRLLNGELRDVLPGGALGDTVQSNACIDRVSNLCRIELAWEPRRQKGRAVSTNHRTENEPVVHGHTLDDEHFDVCSRHDKESSGEEEGQLNGEKHHAPGLDVITTSRVQCVIHIAN